MRIITREHVLKSGIADAVYAQSVIENAFKQKATGRAFIAQEIAMIPESVEKAAFYSLPTYLADEAVAGIKWTTHVKPTGVGAQGQGDVPYSHPVVVLNDLVTGQPTALVEGLLISGLRTGAVSGTALKYLANSQSNSLLLCGSGFQAEHQARAALPFLPKLKELHIWNRTLTHAEQLKERLSDECHSRGINIYVHTTLPSKLDFAQIVIAATSATESYMNADHFVPGHLFISIGMRDIETAAIEQFDHIVCDDFQAGLLTSSQSFFHLARANPSIEQKVVLLEDLILDKTTLQQSNDQKLMFNAFGLPIFDIALANAVTCRVQEMDISAPHVDMYGEG